MSENTAPLDLEEVDADLLPSPRFAPDEKLLDGADTVVDVADPLEAEANLPEGGPDGL